MKKTVPALFAAALLAGTAAGQTVQVDPAIQPYKPVSGVSGNLSSIGSDSLNNLMTLWAEKFNKTYPNVKIQIEGKGSSTAPPALISATAQLGPMSRAMKGSEIDEFEKKYGYKPTQVRVAVDALAVFVNKDNPVACLTVEQVDGIFSKSRRSGYKENVKSWGQLGLTGDWASRPVSLFGRNSASGTYGFFKEHVLKNGDYKDEVKEQPGSASVVQGVTVDRFAIGLLRHRLRDGGRQGGAAGREAGRQVPPGDRRRGVFRQLPARPLPLRLREPRPRQAARPARRRVPQAGPLEGRAGGRRQGRLLPAARQDRAGRARQAPQVEARQSCPPRSRASPAGGPPASTRRVAAVRPASRRALADRLATRFVTLSGVLIIAAILAILFVIVGVVWPLLRPPSATSVPAGALPAGTFPLALAVDEYREEAFVATKSGLLVLPVAGGKATAADLPGLGEATVVKAVAPEPELIVLGLSDGRLYPVAVSTEVAYDEGKRRVTPSIRPGTPVIVDPAGKPAGVFKYVRGPDGPIALVATGPRELTLVRVVEKTSLMGETTREEARVVLPVTASGEVTSLALDVRGQDIFAGTSNGEIVRFDLRDEQNPKQEETVAASVPGTAVTILGFLNGDRTLVSGDAAGRVSSWQVVQAEDGGSQEAGENPRVPAPRGGRHGLLGLAAGQGLRDG